jgi:hypothetical protein
VIAVHVEQTAADQLQHLRIRYFRHQDGIGRGMGGGDKIVGMPGRIDAIDADEHLASTEAAGLHGIGDLAARGLLGLGRHRIFQVEDDAVGGERLGFFQRAGIGARHVKHAAARTKGHAGDFIGRLETIKPRECVSARQNVRSGFRFSWG